MKEERLKEIEDSIDFQYELWNGKDTILLDEEKELYDEVVRLHNIIKALHKYFTEHEQYEDNEFLRQLESCTENDKVWLERMAGVKEW